MGYDGIRWDGMGWDGMGWDGMGREGKGREVEREWASLTPSISLTSSQVKSSQVTYAIHQFDECSQRVAMRHHLQQQHI
jgi:hypothetical protein